MYLQSAYQSLKTLLNTNDSLVIFSNIAYAPLQVNSLIDSSAINNHPNVAIYLSKYANSRAKQKVEKAQGLP